MNDILKTISFNDVIGYEKEKRELREIQSFIINIKKYEEIGARIPKGIMLIGESGNGKTLMAKALSAEINIPFYSIGDELNEDTTVKSIRDVFNEARKNSPCVIFIDEIDKLDGSRSFMSDFHSDKTSSLIRELLTQMDGFQTNCGILVIATANSTIHLNKSLLRSGRFDRIIDIRMPNKNERKQLFEYYSRNKKINSDVNFEKLAIRTSGLCCADIDNILNDAALTAIRKNQDEIGMKDIETSIDRVMFGTIENKLSDDTRKKIAVHEVGHAIVAIGTGQKEDLNKISLISRGQTLGFNRFSRDDVEMFDFTTKSKLFNRMMIAYGGIAAEQIVLKDITSGCVQDIRDAKYIADVMIKKYGMLGITNCADTLTLSLEDGSSQKKKRKVEKLMDGLLEKALKGAIKIIKENRLLFDNLYNKLIESNVLYKEEIEEVISGVSLS